MFERNYKLLNNKYWEFLIPTILTVMTGNIALIIDSIIVSTLVGTVALSGIQVIEPLASFFSLLCWMMGLGGSILYTATKVDFDEKEANKIFTVAVASVAIIGLILTVIGLSFTGNIIQLLSNSPQANSYAIEYFKMYIWCAPFLCYMFCLYYFVRGEGMTRLTFKSSLILSIVNLTFDIVLMKYFNMGIAGSGLATTISYIAASTYVSVNFFKSTNSIEFVKVKLHSFISTFLRICKSGFAGASDQLYTTITLLIYNYLIILFSGTEGLFSLQICTNTLFFISIFLIGLMQAASPMLSVYYREEDYSGVNYVKNKSLKLIFIVGFVFAVLLITFPDVLLVLYSVSDQSSQFVLNSIRLYGLRYLTLGFTVFYVFYAQSIQKDKLANIVSIGHDLIITILLVYAFAFAFGISGIWISYFCIDLITLVLLFIYSRYLHKKSNGEYEGIFINKAPKDNVFEFTINANVDEANELSSLVGKTLKSNLADYASSSLREFLMDTIEMNDEMDTIDVFLKEEEDSISISVKDSGIERKEDFTFKNDNPNCTRTFNYARVLGLNSSNITIS
jgi:Na+-driven multidrug efflux pump